MENITLIGMKDLNQRLMRIERSLDGIAKSLETLVKIQNKKVTPPKIVNDETDEEED
jgi:cystathionine beta-lyase/cystathionine gamma-synthase